MKTINGKNYFNEKSLKEACTELENGNTIEMYIDCIGHTRNNNEQEAYREALTEIFKDRLNVEKIEGGYSYHYVYKLKYLIGSVL